MTEEEFKERMKRFKLFNTERFGNSPSHLPEKIKFVVRFLSVVQNYERSCLKLLLELDNDEIEYLKQAVTEELSFYHSVFINFLMSPREELELKYNSMLIEEIIT